MVWVDRTTSHERVLPGGSAAWAEVNKLADNLMWEEREKLWKCKERILAGEAQERSGGGRLPAACAWQAALTTGRNGPRASFGGFARMLIEANCPRRRGPSHHGRPLPSLRRCRSRAGHGAVPVLELNHADAAGATTSRSTSRTGPLFAVKVDQARHGSQSGSFSRMALRLRRSRSNSDSVTVLHQLSACAISHPLDWVSPWLHAVDLPCRACL